MREDLKSATRKQHNHSHNNRLNDNAKSDTNASKVEHNTRHTATGSNAIQDTSIETDLDKISQLTNLSSKALTETTHQAQTTDHLPSIGNENFTAEGVSSKTNSEENTPQVSTTSNLLAINDAVNSSRDEEKSVSLNNVGEFSKMHQKIFSGLADRLFQSPHKDYGIYINPELRQSFKGFLEQPILSQKFGHSLTVAEIRRIQQQTSYKQSISILKARHTPRAVPATPTSGSSCEGGKEQQEEQLQGGGQGGEQERGQGEQERGRNNNGGASAGAGAGGSGGGDDRKNNERKVNSTGEVEDSDDEDEEEEVKKKEANSDERKDSGFGSLGDTQKTKDACTPWVNETREDLKFEPEKTQLVNECASPLCPREELQKKEVYNHLPQPSPPAKMHTLKSFQHQEPGQPVPQQCPCTQDNGSAVGSSLSLPPSAGSDSAMPDDVENDQLVTGQIRTQPTPSPSSSRRVKQEVGPENIVNQFLGHAGFEDSSSSSHNLEPGSQEHIDLDSDTS